MFFNLVIGFKVTRMYPAEENEGQKIKMIKSQLGRVFIIYCTIITFGRAKQI